MFVLLAVASCESAHSATRDAAPTLDTTPTAQAATVAPAPTATVRPAEASEQFWWNDAVFYQIFVRSFYDSDGNGTGDLNGVMEKLDYLNDGDPNTADDLGVTGIWLMPITQSPSYHGYDVTDYYTVERDYGTNADFQRLVQEAHDRGIRVIVDLVMNHTSSQHPWFLEARNDVGSSYRDYYVWSEDDPGYKGPWGARAWHRVASGYYYGVFWEGMPDLNYENPQVTAEMRDVISFWLEELGADGFRLDGLKHIIEDGRTQENTAATHEWLRDFHSFYKSVEPDAITVGEVWSPTSRVVEYVGDQVDVAFEFDTAEAMLNSAKYEDRNPILRAHRLIADRYPLNQFATFLTNHDQNRVMSQLGENTDHAKTAAALLLTGPGVPFIYYGEEIGQVGKKPDENIRTPMQWTGGESAGFTDGLKGWQAPQSNYPDVNVDVQSDDVDSLLNHYRDLIGARSEHEALRIGDWREVQVQDRSIYAFLRESDEETLLVLINLGSEPVSEYDLNLEAGPLSEGSASDMLSGNEISSPAVNVRGGFDDYKPLEELGAFSTYIVRLR